MSLQELCRKEGNCFILSKFLRVFAYAFISIVLPVYIVASYPRGVSLFSYVMDCKVFAGILISLTIFATIPFNFVVTFYTKRFGERKLLIALSLVMALSGILFAWNPSPWVVILAALLGAISTTGTETGPFQSIEQAVLSTRTEDRKRTFKLSVYNFSGYVALSLGSLFAGLPDMFNSTGSDFFLKVMFVIYAEMAMGLAAIYYIADDIDISKNNKHDPEKSLTVSPKAKGTVTRLSVLFSMDAFGGGFVLQSLLALWFNTVYHFDLQQLSWVFFVSGIITAISIFLAAIISRRIGLLNTMVFSHLPSSIFLILIPFAPNAFIAVMFLFARQSISQMDVPTRQSYMMAIIKSEDRTATGAITNMSRTAAQGVSPPIATSMMSASMYTLPFVLGGGFKIAYDILIYFTFRKIKPPEEKEIEERRKADKQNGKKRDKRNEKK